MWKMEASGHRTIGRLILRWRDDIKKAYRRQEYREKKQLVPDDANLMRDTKYEKCQKKYYALKHNQAVTFGDVNIM